VLRTVLAVPYYLAALVLAAVVVANASAASEHYGAVYEQLTPARKANTELKRLLETLTFGLYDGAAESGAELESLVRAAESHEAVAHLAGWALGGLSTLFLVVIGWPRRASLRALAAHVLGVSLVFLVVGLLAPILSFVAYTEIALLGKVVLRYESKGILTTVMTLITGGNAFVGILLLVFSVVTPTAKLVLLGLALHAAEHDRRRYVHAVATFGKWSMADVLVVAVLLTFFMGRGEGFSDSWLGPGLYFFAGYCLLSLVAVELTGRIDARARLGASAAQARR